MLELSESVKAMFKEVAGALVGAPRRRFMARLVGELGKGGQRAAERELGWDRDTIRKGQAELRTGVEIPDGRAHNRAKTLEERGFPDLRADLDAIVRDHSQTDPTFRTTQRYRRLTVAEVLRCLAEKGYESLPSEESIRTRLDAMGYKPLRVRKTIPPKKSRRPMRSSNTSPR
jgi:Rhodopirellula transposase DDE domain